jgi:hypothetical protein
MARLEPGDVSGAMKGIGEAWYLDLTDPGYWWYAVPTVVGGLRAGPEAAGTSGASTKLTVLRSATSEWMGETDGQILRLKHVSPQTATMCLVKPGIGGFFPVEGSPIGNGWTKDYVRLFVFVEPSIGGFRVSDSPE